MQQLVMERVGEKTWREGRTEPMGAHIAEGGVNFAYFSDHAERIELCVFSADGSRETARHELIKSRDGVFHGFLAGAGPGLVYGLRVHGPYEPREGHRFNANKLLLDPWAREIVGEFSWRAEHHGYTLGHADGPFSFDARDNAAHALKARVVSPANDNALRKAAPRHAGSDVVLYEMHVKGFTQTHSGIPPAMRGTYAGLAHPAAIAHLKSLGVTTLSLLPVQYHIDEPGLSERGLVNYWGYNTLGFFCPDPRFAMDGHDPSAVNAEFREMVRTLHAHGLEVVLDVVYNHTPEGNEYGPTLSFRGLDNAAWYRSMPGDPSRSENLTGCGNTLNAADPRVARFVIDSLRYWVIEMGVDGFRFDLAPVLGRTQAGFEPDAVFFRMLREDPVLSHVRLIAEPWDAGPEGYQLGRFPVPFLEWNDKFRDAARSLWLPRNERLNGNGHHSGFHMTRREFAERFLGSAALFEGGGRKPTASVNFISVHDGFTLADMVSHSRKHNLANGEDNRDGRDEELCANFGVEGLTLDATVTARREHARRAMVATLAFARGTPMLCAGDEIGNSQQGNNNAYCQDNSTGWLDWQTADFGFRDFVARALAFRRAEPLLRQDDWNGASKVRWTMSDGHEFGEHDWLATHAGAFACVMSSSEGNGRPGNRGNPGGGHGTSQLMLIFNSATEALSFALPPGEWRVAFDSGGGTVPNSPHAGVFAMPARAVVALRNVTS
jgi:glycogen debranching enzyme GlgX